MHNEDNKAQSAPRFTTHAKLFDNEKYGQVLIFLERDGEGPLSVMFQVWHQHLDHQIRAEVSSGSDETAERIFEAIDDEGAPLLIEELGIADLLEMDDLPDA